MYVNHVFYCAHHLHSSYLLTNIRLTKVVTPVWPPKGLRDRLVARGRKRLCTTALRVSPLPRGTSRPSMYRVYKGLSISLCLSVSVSLTLSLCLPVSLSLSLSVCLCLSFSVCLSVSVSVSLSLYLSLSVSFSVSHSLYPSFCLSFCGCLLLFHKIVYRLVYIGLFNQNYGDDRPTLNPVIRASYC